MSIKKAFSLAEVLLTLMIIGVIASMTIPALKNDAMNKTTAVNLKKIYSELNQATSLILTESMVGKLCRTNISKNAETFENDFIKKRLNVIIECPAGEPEKCFGDGTFASQYLANVKSYLLNSGIAIAFDNPTAFQDCTSPISYIYIDVNGPKPPNKGGSDVFMLEMNGKGQVYTGSSPDSITMGGIDMAARVENYKDNCSGDDADEYSMAWACAAKIQNDGWEVKY